MPNFFRITNLGENVLEDTPINLDFVEQEILFLLVNEGPLTLNQITSNLQIEASINILSFRVQTILNSLESKDLVTSFKAPIVSKERGPLKSHPTTGFKDTKRRALMGSFSPEERLEDEDLSEFIIFEEPDVKFRVDTVISPN